LPQEVEAYQGVAVTFWEHQPDDGDELGPAALADALRRLHSQLARYDRALPSFDDELIMVERLLHHRETLPSLSAADRQLLHATLLELRDRLRRRDPPHVALHGSPHRGNVVAVA